MIDDLHPVRIRLRAPAASSPRARAVRRQFDIAPRSTRLAIDVQLPPAGGDWRIGAIVGASGSGKSQVLAAAFADSLVKPATWPADRPIVDCLAVGSADEAAALLSAVGLGSVPAWLRPFATLSAGEQFRAELARALASRRQLVAIDEFTSCLDRVVARSCSAAVGKFLRQSGRPRLVIATCHEDVLPWLAPDWVLRMPSGRLDWRRLRRPRLAIDVRAGCRALWPHFAPHHYLTHRLHPATACYAAFVAGQPAAFCATLANLGRRAWRLVTHPDYQGLGLGLALLELVAEHEARGLGEERRVSIVTSHPALVARLSRSPRWRTLWERSTPHPHSYEVGRVADSGSRRRASYLWRGACRFSRRRLK
jgi:predicted ABC-type transport system involved in lysophospholipase L1 biosynthesis ATPase subunit